MEVEYMIAFSIINRVCQSKGLPMYKVMYAKLFGRRNISIALSEVKSVSVRNIRLETKLTHRQIGQLLTCIDHTASIYFNNMYDDLYKMDKHFRLFADNALN